MRFWVTNQKEKAALWVADRVDVMAGGVPLGDYQAIALCNEKRVLAACIYTDYNGHDMQLSFASDGPAWATRNAIRGFLDYPFNKAGCIRVTALCSKKNKRIRKFLEGLGFVYEGKKRKGYNGIDDLICYGLLYSEAKKWLTHGDCYGKQKLNACA